METISSWSDVNWPEINRRIYRLQVRIYKASQNEDRDKMHKLQKLLITGNSAKLLAVKILIQEDEGKYLPKTDGLKHVSSSKRFELAQSLRLDGNSNNIHGVNVLKPCENLRSLVISKLEDRAKQALVSLALQPQWQAKFKSQTSVSRSENDATKAIFLSIGKKQKWVLAVYIEQCFDTSNYTKLLVKCNTFLSVKRQLNYWLKAGILYEKSCLFSQVGTSYGAISALLSSIALHGLKDRLESYENKVLSGKIDNIHSLSYVRHSGDFVIMHPDLEVIQKSREITLQFLAEMDLTLSSTKTNIVHTFYNQEGMQAGFKFLMFDVLQKQKCKIRKLIVTKPVSDQSFVTLVIPSKEVVNSHKFNLREIIKKCKGVSQENLIYNLNPIIRGWALSKRTQVSSTILSEMDTFIYFHLWNWARKRHPKMCQTQIKDKYWHTVSKSNWVFGVRSKETKIGTRQVSVLLQKHSAI
jgi:RNA-directed DNA polymerase